MPRILVLALIFAASACSKKQKSPRPKPQSHPVVACDVSKKPKSAHEGLELVSRLQCEAAGGEWTDTWHEVPEAIRVAAIARGQTTGPLGGRRNGGFRGCVGLPTRDQFMRCVGDWECEGTCQEWTGLCSERIDPMPYGGCRPHCIDGQVKNMCTN